VSGVEATGECEETDALRSSSWKGRQAARTVSGVPNEILVVSSSLYNIQSDIPEKEKFERPASPE
jgi:hypothetical protein